MGSTPTNRLSNIATRYNITCWLHRVRIMCAHCAWQCWWEGGNAADLTKLMTDHYTTCPGQE